MKQAITECLIDWAERGWVPDPLLRVGIRNLLKKRLAKEDLGIGRCQFEKSPSVSGSVFTRSDCGNDREGE